MPSSFSGKKIYNVRNIGYMVALFGVFLVCVIWVGCFGKSRLKINRRWIMRLKKQKIMPEVLKSIPYGQYGGRSDCPFLEIRV